MNKVILMGRLTKDPEVKQTPNNIEVCSFTIACDRRFKTQSGERQADFINCVAWKQHATLLGNYFHKGSRIAIVGSLQSRSYDDQSGQKRYVTEVIVDEIEFVDTKADANNQQATAPQVDQTAVQQAPAVQQNLQMPPQHTEQVADVTGFTPVEEITADSSMLPFDVGNVGF